MPKQNRRPGNAEQEHIACIASIYPPARGLSAKQAPFPPPRPPRRTPPGQPGKQGVQAEASSACAHRAAAPRTSAQICAVPTKRSCASYGRAMARATLTSLGPCAPMRRRCKPKLLLGAWICRVSPHFKAFHAERAGLQLQSRPFCCPYPPNRSSIYAQNARETPEIRGSEDHSEPRLKAFSTFGQSIQRMRSRDCLSANKLPGQRRAP